MNKTHVPFPTAEELAAQRDEFNEIFPLTANIPVITTDNPKTGYTALSARSDQFNYSTQSILMETQQIQNPALNEVAALVHAERVRQDQKWGFGRDHNLSLWLLILQEEVGELATALLEEEPHEQTLAEAVPVAAVAVQLCEWASRRAGWRNNTEEVITMLLERWDMQPGDPLVCFCRVMKQAGDLADQVNSTDTNGLSRTIQLLAGHGLELAYRIKLNP